MLNVLLQTSITMIENSSTPFHISKHCSTTIYIHQQMKTKACITIPLYFHHTDPIGITNENLKKVSKQYDFNCRQKFHQVAATSPFDSRPVHVNRLIVVSVVYRFIYIHLRNLLEIYSEFSRYEVYISYKH